MNVVSPKATYRKYFSELKPSSEGKFEMPRMITVASTGATRPPINTVQLRDKH